MSEPSGFGVGGTCDPLFAGVRDAFVTNFTERDEVGAAVCVVVDGTTVVDLWGGAADPGSAAAADDPTSPAERAERVEPVEAAGAAERVARPWRPDTLVNAFSVGKGLLALLAARLVGQGRLDVDARVVDLWPEFGAAGKEQVTVRHLLTHQAGLPALHDQAPADLMFDWGAMTAALAAETPWWPPGSAHGYHVNTFGFLVGEVLRRVTGRTPGDLLRTEVAGPLGADVHLGVAAADDARVARFLWPTTPGAEPAAAPAATPSPSPAPASASAPATPELTDAERMQFHAYFNPPGLSGAGVVNTRAWRAAEMPSTNTHASARGVAAVYRALAAGGRIDGITVVDPAALAEATVEQVNGPDVVLGRPTRFGLGFQLTQPDRPLGPNPGAFGHFGAGGSLGFCDPDAGVAFGYVMNQLGPRWQNPRNRALVDAVFAALA